MRRLIAIAGAVALAGAMAVPAAATPEPVSDGYGHKDVVCHATSAKGKWVRIEVDTASAAHAKKLTAHELHAVPGNKRHGQVDTIHRGLTDEEADAIECGASGGGGGDTY